MSPLFLCDLALRLGMPVGEMCSRMSAHELSVIWPAYFAVEAEREKRAQREQQIRDRQRR